MSQGRFGLASGHKSHRSQALHHGHHAPLPSHHHHDSHLALGMKRLREKRLHHIAHGRPQVSVVSKNVPSEPASRPCASVNVTVEMSADQKGRRQYRMIPYGLPYGVPLDKFYKAPKVEQKRKGDSKNRPRTYLCLAAVAFVCNPPIGILALLVSWKVRHSLMAGNLDAAASDSKLVVTLCVLSFFLLPVLVCLACYNVYGR